MVTETQEQQSYLTLSEREQKEFTAKLMHAVAHFHTAYLLAQYAIEIAERYGIFKNVKFENK